MTSRTDIPAGATLHKLAAKRSARVLSTAITASLLLHVGMLLVSTNLYLKSHAELGREAARLFKIEMTRMIPERPPLPPPPAPDVVESIEKILSEEAVLEPPEITQPPDSADRIAEQMRDKARIEYLPREGMGDVSEESAETVDLKVVALAREAFGEGLGPRRRQVAPGGSIVVPSGALPIWSAPGAAGTSRRAESARPDIAVRETQAAAERSEDVARKLADDEPGLAELHGKLARSERLLPELALPIDVLPDLEERESVRKYESLDELLEIELYAYRPVGSAGYFMVRITARADAQLSVLPKDIVFVLDSSKSMGASKLKEGCEAVRICLDRLNPHDRFNVVAFSKEPVFFADDLVDAAPANRAAAARFLRGLVAGGQTDVYAALQPLVRRAPRQNVSHIILLFSDGKSTVGDLDSREIINQLTELNRSGARASIYAFGGGSGVNRYLLDLLALRNKGASEVTRVVSRIDKDMPAFYGRLRDPILTDVTANYGGLDLDEIFPGRLPDFYLGSDMAVFGRFDGEQEFSMRLTGVVNGVRKELVFRRRFDSALRADDDAARLWATRKAYHVIEQICAQGPLPELVNQLSVLNTQYGVRTAYDQSGYGQ